MDTNKFALAQARPFRTLHFGRNQIIAFLFPLFFNGMFLLAINPITEMWGKIIQFFLTKIGLDATLVTDTHWFFHLFSWNIYYPALPAVMPSFLGWFSNLLMVVALLTLNYLSSSYFFSLKTFIRLILLIQFCTLAYFFAAPNSFPYYLPDYVRNGFIQGIILIVLCPWIFALTYYIQQHSLRNKFLITAITELYLIFFIPFQYLVHILIIHYFSLLYMPVLYFLFGVLLNVFLIIVFYSIGCSLNDENL